MHFWMGYPKVPLQNRQTKIVECPSEIFVVWSPLTRIQTRLVSSIFQHQQELLLRRIISNTIATPPNTNNNDNRLPKKGLTHTSVESKRPLPGKSKSNIAPCNATVINLDQYDDEDALFCIRNGQRSSVAKTACSRCVTIIRTSQAKPSCAKALEVRSHLRSTP